MLELTNEELLDAIVAVRIRSLHLHNLADDANRHTKPGYGADRFDDASHNAKVWRSAAERFTHLADKMRSEANRRKI